MNVTEAAVRELCTDAVFARGENYLADGRIRRLTRFDDTITAVVGGSRDYDITLDLAAAGFDPRCSCPYDGPGVWKHVVAVLLRLADGRPADESGRIDTVLERARGDELRAFLREELRTDPSLRDRFLARFGESTTRSVDELRAEIDRLFAEMNPDYAVVFEPIDLSDWFDLAEEYRAQDEYRSAATVYRALDGYVDCVAKADLDAGENSTAVQFLDERAASGTDYLRDRFMDAGDELRARTDADQSAGS